MKKAGKSSDKNETEASKGLSSRIWQHNSQNLLSAFEQLKSEHESNKISSKDIAELIEKMSRVKDRVEKHEIAEERLRRRDEILQKKKARISRVTSMELPLNWENSFENSDSIKGVHADSPADGLLICLSELGRVDIEYISAITGADCKSVIHALKGAIYQNPETWDECFYKGWESADEYLSGNLSKKLRAASEANGKYIGYFSDNVSALKKNMPPHLAVDDIYITLGSPWIPTDVIDDFISYLFGESIFGYAVATKHDSITGSWEIPEKNRYGYDVKVSEIYGTNRINALHILERTLNMKTISVTDPILFYEEKRKLNQSETVLALEKQQKLIKAFQKWVWEDDFRAKRLIKIFEENFLCVRQRHFDGSYLTFPGMCDEVKLYSYQKNAVARILLSPNTLLAHDVGSGKTYVMIAAGMELRRLGLSKKNMYVVPNNIVGQWKKLFYKLYPEADIMCIEPNGFKPEKREQVLEHIRDEEHDAIIIAASCFEQIPLSKKYYETQLTEQLNTISTAANVKNKATSRLKHKSEVLRKALSELAVTVENMYDTVYFDELGVTRLFVDEAHNYKNVPIETKSDHVFGISSGGSSKCREMMDKVKLVQKQNNGGGVVFATGTPITNSLTDIFVMQKYLQDGQLALLELQNFDSWIGMFAEKRTEFEIDVDTSKYRLVTRFSEFHNLPELTTLLSDIADFHQADETSGIPSTDGYIDALVSKSYEFQNYLDSISKRADMVRSRLVDRKEDNMLKITSDGRKAALDLRLVVDSATDTAISKVARCAENVADIYLQTMPQRSSQLIFCDTSTPKAGFNLYDELKSKLINYGVAECEIAYVHDANTEKKREVLFEKVRCGEIRVLIGSTFKLGLGVNVQNKLAALHHLDVPWRPADMTQREGRILRQGNENSKVKIYRYIMAGSFDAYSWQLLETKARFISRILSGSVTERSGSDVDEIVLSYAEVKALAIGEPLIKERVETANELSRLYTLKQKDIEARGRLTQELSEIPGSRESLDALIGNCEKDITQYGEWIGQNPKAVDSKSKAEEAEKRRKIRGEIHNAVASYSDGSGERVILNYCGFDVVLPTNMLPQKPYIWIVCNGKYYIELGESDVGYLTRIDNFLETMDAFLAKLKADRKALNEKELHIREELDKKEEYSNRIERMEKKLKSIDKKLGVKKE